MAQDKEVRSGGKSADVLGKTMEPTDEEGFAASDGKNETKTRDEGTVTGEKAKDN